MIGYLSGDVIEKSLNSAIIVCGGVGYRVNYSGMDADKFSLGEVASFWIYEQIREQSYELFGFMTKDGMAVFEKLLSVNGVGPKMALSILGIGSVGELSGAIARADAKYIAQASGVGKKLAEKVILELAGKLSDTALESTQVVGRKREAPVEDEAVDALVSLGYSLKDAVAALERVDSSLSAEDRIKIVLRGQ